MAEETNEDFNKSQRTRLLEAADEFAGHTSLGGIPFIRDGHRFWYKMFWTVVFVGACAGGAYNLSDNIRRYLRYEYNTQVTLTYDYLDFPSVTVCNINPVRLSAIAQYGTDNVKYFFGQLTPSQQYTWDYNQQTSTTSIKAPDKSRKRKRRKRQAVTTDSYLQENTSAISENSTNWTVELSTFSTFIATTTPVTTTTTPTTTTIAPNTTTTTPNTITNTPATTTTTPTTTMTTPTTTTTIPFIATTTITPATMSTATSTTISTTTTTTITTPTYNTTAAPVEVTTLTSKATTETVITTTPPTTTPPITPAPNNYLSVPNITLPYINYVVNVSQSSDSSSVFGSGQPSAELLVTEAYLSVMASIDPGIRSEIGQHKSMFILTCTFNGFECSPNNFTQYMDPAYGNCFTFNDLTPERSAPLKSKQTGTTYGLNLLLYLEDHERIVGLGRGRGVRFTLNSFNTMPLVEDHGFSAMPGYETFVGMKMVQIQRLSEPWEKCGDGGEFVNYYNRQYTVAACVETCLDRTIAKQCGCYRDDYLFYYNQTDIDTLPSCYSNKTMLICAYNLRSQQENGNSTNCDCTQSCQDTTFDMQTSANTFLDASYWYNLVNLVCDREGYGPDCIYLQTRSVDDRPAVINNNFVSLSLYYQEFNYERLEDSPAYALFNLLSDIGGALGLWTGVSIITCVEVMDFTAQIIYILMTGCSRRDIVQPQSARPRISRPSTSQSQRSDIMPPTTGEKTDTSPVPRQRSASRLLKSANVYLYDDKNWEDTSETANFTQESNSNNSSGVSSGMTDVMTPESAVTPQSKPHVKAKKKKKRITWRRPTVVKPTPLVKNFVDDHKIPWYP